MNRAFILHYHEIWLKGGNKNYFLSRLRSAIKQSVCDLPVQSLSSTAERFLLVPGDESAAPAILERYAGFLVSPTLHWPARFRVRLLNWVLRLAP